MSRSISKGATNQSTVIRILDETDGTPEQAVEHNTTGIALWYRREGSTKQTITPVALTALDDAHSDGGIEHIDDGYYRLDVPDAAFATGADGVMIGGVVTGMVIQGAYHELVDVIDSSNPIDAALTATSRAAVTDDIWDEARSGHTTAGTFGEGTASVQGNITGSVGSVTGNVDGAVASVTGAVGSVTGNVGGNVTGSVGSLDTQAKADVNAEVLDVLNTDTFAEPGQEAPGATISLAAKIGYLYKAWRNRSAQTATTYSLYNDDATTVGHKATVSDDGNTFEKGEVVTGP